VTGEVVNLTSETISAPMLQLRLENRSGEALVDWFVEIDEVKSALRAVQDIAVLRLHALVRLRGGEVLPVIRETGLHYRDHLYRPYHSRRRIHHHCVPADRHRLLRLHFPVEIRLQLVPLQLHAGRKLRHFAPLIFAGLLAATAVTVFTLTLFAFTIRRDCIA